ncbi:signal peptidase I [bacterium]|nr:MAG: signal peptidase I [bacterium]
MVLRGKILISAAAIGLASLAAQPKRLAVVVGNSMAPTYNGGELLITKPLDRPLRHGDVVLVNGPEGPILKRVALLPGDYRMQWRRTQGWMDMTQIGKPHKISSMSKVRKIPIPAGHVYLLGDNLEYSIDSREFGPVPIESIRALVIDSRPPAVGSLVMDPIPRSWLAQGIRDNRLLAHGKAKADQPTNL